MQECGVATCPKNAVVEIKAIADYISDKDGGKGCVRDIIEQVMRCNGDWFEPES
jgi:3-deoxy-D-manno-octulosonate 8-phosphate phosphatase (KDO 8-P phosphatase)